MLRLDDVHAYYDESHVLRGVTLHVDAGEVVTLVGRNGVGKTTTLRTIIGIVHARAGTILFEDQPIQTLSSDRVAQLGIGFVPEERGIMSTLSVYENLTLPPVVGTNAWPLEKIYDAFPILKMRARAAGTTLSGGEQQMLAIARVLRSGSRLILLDEPTEGLAPVIVEQIGEVIREIKKHGVTILLVEQNVRFATGVADRHYLMAHGCIVESLTNAEMLSRQTELLEHLGV
ncbi:MAG: ABC transporter ATP-binding protein [Vulcanimicrobiaceae bacterium]|jgi:branched-chain amino acid transport system ATP-binding protein